MSWTTMSPILLDGAWKKRERARSRHRRLWISGCVPGLTGVSKGKNATQTVKKEERRGRERVGEGMCIVYYSNSLYCLLLGGWVL